MQLLTQTESWVSGGLKGVRGSVSCGLTALSKWLLSSEQQCDDDGGVCVCVCGMLHSGGCWFESTL